MRAARLGDASQGGVCRVPAGGVRWQSPGPSQGFQGVGDPPSLPADHASRGGNWPKAVEGRAHKLHSVWLGRHQPAGSVGGPSNQSLKLSPGSVVAERHVVVLRAPVGCEVLVVGLPGAAQL